MRTSILKKAAKASLAVMLTLFIALLAACGQGSNQADTSNAQSAGNSGGSDSQEKITIKIAHVVAEDVSSHKRFLKFKELVESKSNGKFNVEIYPNSQMGGEREITESVQMGSIQIASPSVGLLSNFSGALQVFDLPFIFKDSETAYTVLDGPVGSDLLKGLESSGFVGLGFGENGWRHLTTAKGPITSPDQIQGIKLRTMQVPLHMAFWRQIGVSPTPMAFSEVFTALSQGVVDGQENPLELIYSMKFHEPNKFITTTGHIYDSEVVIANKQFLDSLSPEDQTLIKDSMMEAIKYQRSLNKDLDKTLREKLKAEGATITDLTPEQKNVWVEKVKPIYKEFAQKHGKETIQKVLEAAGNTTALESLN